MTRGTQAVSEETYFEHPLTDDTSESFCISRPTNNVHHMGWSQTYVISFWNIELFINNIFHLNFQQETSLVHSEQLTSLG